MRKNALKGNSTSFRVAASFSALTCHPLPVDVDLSAIARTSMAVSSSPPKEAPIATGTSVRFLTLLSLDVVLTIRIPFSPRSNLSVT